MSIVAFPFLRYPTPTISSSTLTTTAPVFTGMPVSLSVTVTFNVTLPMVLFITCAVVLLGLCSTNTLMVVFVELYVSLPG